MEEQNIKEPSFRKFIRFIAVNIKNVGVNMKNIIVNTDSFSFLEGCISGMVGVTLSHPADTIKSNLQTGQKVQYNFKFLYRGIKSPLIGTGIEKALVFGTFNNVNDFLNRNSNSTSSMANIAISGGVSGFMASFIVAPFEKAKILFQTNETVKIRPSDLIKIRDIVATCTREVPGFAIYFTTYKQIEKHGYAGTYTIPGSFVAGGLSGALSWCFIYPQDYVKTIIQKENDSNKSFFNVGKNIYKQNGIRGFYKNFHLALIRAFPLHAGTFATMEILKRY